MSLNSKNLSTIPEEARELPSFEGVCFDPDTVTLLGIYRDELAAHRARRVWGVTLAKSFILDREKDFEFSVSCDYSAGRYVLKCQFVSACGRYAFWRLTNDQAPEAQYEIETAHIPNTLSHHEDFVGAPDLRSMHPEPLVTSDWSNNNHRKSFSAWVNGVVAKILGKS